MSQTIKETVTTAESMPTTPRPVVVRAAESEDVTGYQTGERLIYFFFGALEVLLIFRLVLLMTGASLSSGFVKFIYNFSQIFVVPFNGIFRTDVAEVADSTNLVFEPSTIVAIVVYAILAVGLAKLLRVISGKKQELD